MAKPKNLTPLQTAMAETAFLREVTRAAIVGLSGLGTIRHYRRRTYLCHQGEPADEVFFVVDGRIEVSSVSTNGSRVFHATIDTPQFVGELGPLGDLPRTASLLALEDSDIWVTDCEAFIDFLMSEPSAARAVIMALARQVQEHQGFVDDLLFLDLKGRVAKRLLQLVTTEPRRSSRRRRVGARGHPVRPRQPLRREPRERDEDPEGVRTAGTPATRRAPLRPREGHRPGEDRRTSSPRRPRAR